MESEGRGGRFKRLAQRLKEWETSSTTPATTSLRGEQTCRVVNNDYNDRQRTQVRYQEAADQLKEAIEIRKGSWGSFDFEELSDEPEHFDDEQFKNKINAVLISRKTSIKDRKGWSSFTYAVECVFTAFRPLAKNFLLVAKDAQ